MSITRNQLIEHYARIHETKLYGQSCHEFATQIQACVVDLKPAVIVEYGCGRSELDKLVKHEGRWVRYDPAIPEVATLSERRADFVINTDVLEHVPSEDIDDLLAHIASLSGHVFFHISTRLATEILPDGTNAHCTVWPASQWLAKLRTHFPEAQMVHDIGGRSCLFITWRSHVAQVISDIESLKTRPRKKKSLGTRLKKLLGR